jgi:hypothetical protein
MPHYSNGLQLTKSKITDDVLCLLELCVSASLQSSRRTQQHKAAASSLASCAIVVWLDTPFMPLVCVHCMYADSNGLRHLPGK